MIVHVLRFAFKGSTSGQQRNDFKEALSRLAGTKWISFAVVGQDLGDPADGYSLSYCVGFKDLAALEGFLLREPLHPLADLMILPHVAKLSVVDLADDPDPTLRDKIGALVQAKIANEPEFVRLMSAIPR
jgi:hypothetical protein